MAEESRRWASRHPGVNVVDIDGVAVDALSQEELVQLVTSDSSARRGGLVLTANADILRLLRTGPMRSLVHRATFVVADGMPLVWASRLQGDPVPERVAGSDLVWRLSRAARDRGLSVYLLGAAAGVASAAAERLVQEFPGLRIAGTLSPPLGFDRDAEAWALVRDEVVSSRPDLVFVALGFPRQEQVSLRLASDLPQTWFLGCGGSLDMVEGSTPRAPQFVQRIGAEWLHRLFLQPRRLFKRYVVDDAPYVVALLARALKRRVRAGRTR